MMILDILLTLIGHGIFCNLKPLGIQKYLPGTRMTWIGRIFTDSYSLVQHKLNLHFYVMESDIINPSFKYLHNII
jgi:hypothetical protein